MKKLVALFLMVSMLITLLTPVSTFAQEDQALQKAIIEVKAKFDIPKEFTKFDYSVYTRSNKKAWNLSWTSKEGNGSTHVTVDEKGTTLNYSTYRDGNYAQQSKLSKINREIAKEIALKFISKVNSQLPSQIRYTENNQNSLGESTYYFMFERMVNNISFNSNNIRVEVNRQTGEVQSYYYNWDDELVFPSADKVISLEEAQKAYKEKLGLTLMYNYKVKDEKISTYLVYGSKLSNYYIDAMTGEKVELQSDYYGPYYGGDMAKNAAAKEAKNDSLSPEELNAVKEVGNLITQEEAEKIARETKFLEITSDLKVRYANLNKDWQPTGNIIWNLDFSKEQMDSEKEYRYVGVRINAKTGEIVGFNISSNRNGDEKAKTDEASAKNLVEKFLKEITPEKFGNMMLDENYKTHYPTPLSKGLSKDMPSYYNFRYVRIVNGIPFAGNTITVNFDSVLNKVTSFNCEWFDEVQFTNPNNAVSVDEVYDKLFKEVGYYLQYKLQYNREVYEKYMGVLPDKDLNMEVKLVFAPTPYKPIMFDALKNVLLNYNGEPYKDNNGVSYKDIDESYAKKEISALAENGISLEGENFNPKQEITQKEYLYLIAKSLYHYETFNLSDKKDVDRMYNTLIREGIVKKDEKSPYASTKREDSVKFIVRALRLDKAAEIKDIFNCKFKDVQQIDPQLIGYVAIANGLNIVTGFDGYFRPQDKLTREDAAVIIYNYLQK